MRKLPLCTLLFVFALSCHAQADEPLIKPGIGIDEVAKQMKAARYKETGLQIVSQSPTIKLKFWSVDPGVLIANYSTVTKKVTHLSFLLAPKEAESRAERYDHSFSLEVTEFSPTTGEMKIKVRQKQTQTQTIKQ